MKKRFLAWVLVLCLLVSALPFQARAASVIASGKLNGFTWVIDDSGTMIVVGTGKFTTEGSGSQLPWYAYKSEVHKVVLDDGVTGFDSTFLSAFENLTDVSLPASLTELNADNFEGCNKLRYLTVDFLNPKFFCQDSVLFSKDMSLLIFCPKGYSGTYQIPRDVKTIGKRAFQGNTNLLEVKFLGQVTKIEDRAFYGCSNLAKITLPGSLETIGASAFESCGLTTITIPSSVKSIGNYAFDCCSKLTSIQVNKNNGSFSSDGIALFNKDKTKLIQYPLNRYGEYTMPNTVREFTTHAFWFNENLTALGMPDSLKSIPDKAFKGCTRLYTLEIPHTVQTIGKEIFSESSATNTVVFYGSAPSTPKGAPFHDPNGTVSMTVYYPEGDKSWSAATRKAYGGKIDWRAGGAMTDFGDVLTYEWYFEPILWAVDNGITAGTSATTFSPGNTCLRSQVVTFLWRAAGQPRPLRNRSPFVDVKKGDYFYNAVLWAVDNGITSGTSANTFGAELSCTRAQVVTFLWRAAGCPDPKSTNNPFKDVKNTDYFYEPVLWAVENGVTAGIDATHFGPNQNCNRAQVVTFMYRVFK